MLFLRSRTNQGHQGYWCLAREEVRAGSRLLLSRICNFVWANRIIGLVIYLYIKSSMRLYNLLEAPVVSQWNTYGNQNCSGLYKVISQLYELWQELRAHKLTYNNRKSLIYGRRSGVLSFKISIGLILNPQWNALWLMRSKSAKMIWANSFLVSNWRLPEKSVHLVRPLGLRSLKKSQLTRFFFHNFHFTWIAQW